MAAWLIPDSATARLGSIPICKVSRSRQTGSRPDLSAGRMPAACQPGPTLSAAGGLASACPAASGAAVGVGFRLGPWIRRAIFSCRNFAGQAGNVELGPTGDEASRIIEVLSCRQQIRMRPDGVPAGDAADVGQITPDQGRLAQPSRPELEADQGGKGALGRTARS